ncbi:MAG: hypothetical protein KGI60_02835 [Patescibacteria group bacterium]|nr:hypothetical protein [Patescibacteria group bacterium]
MHLKDMLLSVPHPLKVTCEFDSMDPSKPASVYIHDNGKLLARVAAYMETKKDFYGNPYQTVTLKLIDLTKALMVAHHDDPPCTARLDPNGNCNKCNLHPDTQSTCLRPYCPACDEPMKNMVCEGCGKKYESCD